MKTFEVPYEILQKTTKAHLSALLTNNFLEAGFDPSKPFSIKYDSVNHVAIYSQAEEADLQHQAATADPVPG